MTSRMYFNGIDGQTGDYAFPSIEVKELARCIRGEPRDRNGFFLARLLKEFFDKIKLSPIEGVKPGDLQQTGWGVVFPENRMAELKGALKPLLDHRREQVGSLYREMTVATNEACYDFLYRGGTTMLPIDPEKMPYYLLLVGGPEEIPYEFQFNLDLQHAVGRIYFDTLEEYTNYAHNVIRAESQTSLPKPPQAAFFGPRHDGDVPTDLSCRHLVEGLAAAMGGAFGGQLKTSTYARDWASKITLKRLLGGDLTPQLLFTATHCHLLAHDHPQQSYDHGALLCAEWPGPSQWRKRSVPPEFFFAGRDVAPDADLTGLIAFIFGCCSGGSPRYSHFPHEPGTPSKTLAQKPFVSRLPMRLLAAPKGCAAVVAHVDSAYLWSFTDWQEREQTQLYRQCLLRLLKGLPLGWAVESFHHAYANRRLQYEEVRQKEIDYPGSYKRDDLRLAHLWFSVNDLRNFLILGDPAVSLGLRLSPKEGDLSEP